MASILLRAHAWNKEKLTQSYFENDSSTLESAGIPSSKSLHPSAPKAEAVSCAVCYDEVQILGLFII